MDLSDYMLKNPIKATADDNIFTAIRLITENKISGLCVVDGENTLVGILSELDCLRAILGATYNQSGDAGTVREFMTTDVVVCKPYYDVVSVARDMLQKGHRRRPVVDGEYKLIGQITCRQLLRAVDEFNKGEQSPRGASAK